MFLEKQNVDVESINSISESINKFGVPIVISAVVIICLFVFIYTVIRQWKQANDSKLKFEREKSQIELEINKKQQTAQLEQNAKMYDFVVDIQSKQINQMENISDVINNLSIDIKKNIDTMESGLMNINSNINDMGIKYSDLEVLLNEVLQYAKENDKNNIIMNEKINEIQRFIKHLKKEATIKDK